MAMLIVNQVQFEFSDGVSYNSVITEAMKHPELKSLTIAKPEKLLYVKNGQFIKHEDLIKQAADDGDEILMLVLLSGG
jgi:hypothetical protein